MVFALAYHRATDAALNTRLDAIREAGDPVDIAALVESHREPSPEDNAAPILVQACREYAAHRDREAEGTLPIFTFSDVPQADEPLSAERLASIRTYLEAHQETLRLLHRAAERDEYRREAAYTTNAAESGEYFGHLRGMAALAYLEGLHRAETGRADEAAESLRTGLRLGYALRHEPFVRAAFYRIACDAIALMPIERWASRSPPSPQALRQVEAARRLEADPERVEWVFVTERCHVVTHGRDLHLTEKPSLILWVPLVSSAYTKGSVVQLIDITNAYLAAARKPYPQSFLAGARLEPVLEGRIPRHYIFCFQFLPPLARLWLEEQRILARLESARVALALLRFRAKHERLPAALEGLVPEFLDSILPGPFTGKPPRYVKSAEGVVVYYLGSNGQDDGGDIEDPLNRYPDIGFRVRWPKPRQ